MLQVGSHILIIAMRVTKFVLFCYANRRNSEKITHYE